MEEGILKLLDAKETIYQGLIQYDTLVNSHRFDLQNTELIMRICHLTGLSDMLLSYKDIFNLSPMDISFEEAVTFDDPELYKKANIDQGSKLLFHFKIFKIPWR